MKTKLAALFFLCLAVCAAQPRLEAERQARIASRGLRGAVAAGTDFAADAAMRLFYIGGNAVDAGVAATLAAAIVEYSHYGFGGECPILIRSSGGEVFSIAGVGPMPKLATPEFFRNRRLHSWELRTREDGGLQHLVPAAGVLPALVPGMVDAVLLALKELGTRSVAEVLLPSVELADGTPLDETRARYIRQYQSFMKRFPETARVFLPHGELPQTGAVLQQRELAMTLRGMIAAETEALRAGMGRAAAIEAVRDYFYRGEVARRIDAFSRANEGLLRYEDMAGFRLKLEQPATTTYRGYTVHKPGFWSQGPVMLQTLNILEGYDLKGMRHNSADYVHHLAEAMKLSFADRDAYYADPAFVNVPAERLLSKEYAAERRALIGLQASAEFQPGQLGGQQPMHPVRWRVAKTEIADDAPSKDTTCVVTVDKDGLVFSATPSGAWLPAVVAGETGILLTQRAQSFYLIPGHPNELAGGKRPRITLSPTLVTKAGRPWLALSTPGGDNQDQALLQVLLNALEFDMNAQAAVETARIQTRHLVSSFDTHAMNPADLLLDERLSDETAKDLSGRGHQVQRRARTASGSAPVLIRVLPNGVIEAGADPYGYRVARAW